MHADHNAKHGRGASFSRRNFLQIAAAGTAATLPAVAEAGSDRQLVELIPLSDEQQLEACIGQLRNILNRMHPDAEIHHPCFLQSYEDGSYRLSVQSDIRFEKFAGDGLYLLSSGGQLSTCWLQQQPGRSFHSGNHIAGCYTYLATVFENGRYGQRARYYGLPNIIRKLEGVAP